MFSGSKLNNCKFLLITIHIDTATVYKRLDIHQIQKGVQRKFMCSTAHK